MNIIIKKAEEELLEFIDGIKNSNENLRCTHFQASRIPEFENEDTIDFIVRDLGHQNGEIFICSDGDLFIIAKKMGPPFTKGLKNFVLTRLETRPALPEELVILFEIQIDHHEIARIIEEKLRVRKHEEKKERHEQERIQWQEQRTRILNKPIPEHFHQILLNRQQSDKETNILVIDDDPFSLKLFTNALPSTYNILLAENGENALFQYFTKAPDIMFLDIGLPDISGHDVLAKILEHDPQAFIIMLSGKGDKDNVMRAIKHGAKGFIGKPLTHDKLQHYIEQSPHIQTING
ncbi:MAG: hypothetical protein COA45_10900 [Zetaproteobacteria bacterium]|nr:MAG: hypothetical protein COA45_10900 [Zetaproteobacteria bacterium]